jgi:hypothetical protein
MSNYYGSENIIEKLFSVYISEYSISYAHLKEVEKLELIAFTYGIVSILSLLNIETDKIIYKNKNLTEFIKDIIKDKYLTDKNRNFSEEKINVIHGKNDVNI